jgi:hypothetical protein
MLYIGYGDMLLCILFYSFVGFKEKIYSQPHNSQRSFQHLLKVIDF